MHLFKCVTSLSDQLPHRKVRSTTKLSANPDHTNYCLSTNPITKSASDLFAAREAGAGPLADLDALTCVRRLRAGGFPAASVADGGRLDEWELRIAGYDGGMDAAVAAAAAAGGGGGGTSSGKQRSKTQELQQPQPLMSPGRRAGSSAGCAATAAAPAAPAGRSHSSAAARSGQAAPGQPGQTTDLSSSSSSSSCLIVCDQRGLDYFRAGCRGVMRMQPERDILPLQLGTSKVGPAAAWWINLRGAAVPCHPVPHLAQPRAQTLPTRQPTSLNKDAKQDRALSASPPPRASPPASPSRARLGSRPSGVGPLPRGGFVAAGRRPSSNGLLAVGGGEGIALT